MSNLVSNGLGFGLIHQGFELWKVGSKWNIIFQFKLLI